MRRLVSFLAGCSGSTSLPTAAWHEPCSAGVEVIISNAGGDMMRLALYLAAAFALFGLDPALAQTWPERPIKAFIPFSAGSATDVIPRVVFEELASELGQPIVV
jgi:hypothetical protein